jgi:hypothetical protein
MGLIIYQGDVLIDTYRYSLPLKWDFIARGIDYIAVQGIHNQEGIVLTLNSIGAKNTTSQASWIVALSNSLASSQEIKATLYISDLPKSTVKDSLVYVRLNDYNITLELNKLEQSSGNINYYVPSTPITQDVSGIKGNFIAIDIPNNFIHKGDRNIIEIKVPPNTEWSVEYIILELEVPSERFSPVLLQPSLVAVLAIIYAFIVGYLVKEYVNQSKMIRKLVLIGFILRVLIAPITEHPYDLEVYKQYIRLFYEHGIINLGYWIYGPLWLFAMLLSTFPVYIFNLSHNGGILNLAIKLPPIISDLAIFVILYKTLKQSIDEESALHISKLGWLFNPIVIYFSSIHGIYSSVVALFILLAYTATKAWLSAIYTSIAIGFLPVSGISFFPMMLKFIHNKRGVLSILFVSIICSFTAYLLPYLVIEKSYILSRIYSYIALKYIVPSSPLVLLNEIFFLNPYIYIIKDYFLYIYILFYIFIIIVYFVKFYDCENEKNLSLKFLLLLFFLFYLIYPGFYSQHLLWILPELLLSVSLFRSRNRVYSFILVMLAILGIFPLLYDSNFPRVIVLKLYPLLPQKELLSPGAYAFVYPLSSLLGASFIAYIISLFKQNSLSKITILEKLIKFFPLLVAGTVLFYVFMSLSTNLLIFVLKSTLLIILLLLIIKSNLFSARSDNIFFKAMFSVIGFFDVSNTAYILREAHFLASWLLIFPVILYLFTFTITIVDYLSG